MFQTSGAQMFVFRPEDFSLHVITQGLDEIARLVEQLNSIFEETVVHMRSHNYDCLLSTLNRAEVELAKVIETIIDHERSLSNLVVDVFRIQKERIENYFNAFPYQTRALNQEYNFAVQFLNTIQNDLKTNVSERVSRNRISMQRILDSVREHKRTWEIAIIRERIEE